MTRHAWPLWLGLLACAENQSTSTDAAVVHPGRGIGPLTIGQPWSSVREALGPPPSEPVVLVRVGVATWPDRGLEVLFTSPADDHATDDAIVIGVGAYRHVALNGIAIDDLDRTQVQAAFGPPPEEYAGHAYYPTGLAIEYGDDDRVDKIAVVASYTLAPVPPPMAPAAGAPR